MPTLPLALYDFLPVVLTAVALFWLWRIVALASPTTSVMAAVGSALVVAGGTAKATWKLVLAASGGSVDLTWLSDSLFVLMAPGFLLLASAVWGVTRTARGLSPAPARVLGPSLAAATLLGAAILAVVVPDAPAWSRLLLGVMVLAVLVLNVMLLVFAVRERVTFAAVLLALNIVGTLALNAMARLSEQTIALQWVEQTVNTGTWLAFAGATGLLYAHVRAGSGAGSAAVDEGSGTGSLA